MSTENITVTLGVTYFIEINVDRFTELLGNEHVLLGEVREANSNILITKFDITKIPATNRISAILTHASTKDFVPNPEILYSYDIISKNGSVVYKLIDGNVTFKKLITTLKVTGSMAVNEINLDILVGI
jgi:hypothetical protein